MQLQCITVHCFVTALHCILHRSTGSTMAQCGGQIAAAGVSMQMQPSEYKSPFFQQFLVTMRLESSNVGPWGEMKVQHLSGKGKCEICTGKGWLDNWGQLISRAANHCVFWFHTHTNATAVGAFQHWCCKVYMGHNSWLKTPSQCVQCCSQQSPLNLVRPTSHLFFSSSPQFHLHRQENFFDSLYCSTHGAYIGSTLLFLCFFVFLCACEGTWVGSSNEIWS